MWQKHQQINSCVFPFRFHPFTLNLWNDMAPDSAPPTTSELVNLSCCSRPPLPKGSMDFQAVMSELDPNKSPRDLITDNDCQLKRRRKSQQNYPLLWQGPMVSYKGTSLHLGTALYLKRTLYQRGFSAGASRLF